MTEQLSLLKEQRSDVFKIDPRQIVVDESSNFRTDYGDIESLAQSILENGIKQPMRGCRDKDGVIHLTDGHRRNRALQMLIERKLIDIENDGFRVPVLLEKSGYRPEDKIFDMFITQDQKPLTDMEICNLFYRLRHTFNFSSAQIAKKVGKSIPYVNDMLRLAAAPKELRDAVEKEEITHTAAIHVIKKHAANHSENGIAPDPIKEVLKKVKQKTKDDKPIAVKDVKERKQKETDVPKGNLGLMKDMLKEIDSYDKQNPNQIDPCKRFGLSFTIRFLDGRDISFAEAIEQFKKD